MADTNDILIGGEAINADSLGLEKTRFPTYKQKQYMIIGGIVLLILILVIVIIVLAVNRGDDSNSKETDKPSDTTHPSDSTTDSPSDTDAPTDADDDDDHNPEDRIGEINAIYRKSGTINILSDEFIKQSKFSIYINDKFVC